MRNHRKAMKAVNSERKIKIIRRKMVAAKAQSAWDKKNKPKQKVEFEKKIVKKTLWGKIKEYLTRIISARW